MKLMNLLKKGMNLLAECFGWVMGKDTDTHTPKQSTKQKNKSSKDEIVKEVEAELYDYLMRVPYGGDKLLEGASNTAKLVLREHGIENADITVSFTKGGNVEVKGVKQSIKQHSNDS